MNKKVIEINRPDSVYFERAVLYLRPDVTEVPLHAAKAETDSYFQDAIPRRRKSGLQSLVPFLLGAVTSTALGAFVLWLIH